VAVDPVDPNIVWAGGVDWFRSDDGGATWGAASFWWADRMAPAFVHADQHALRFHPAYDGAGNQTLFIAGDGGIFRSDNARAAVATGMPALCNPVNTKVAWHDLDNGLEITQFYFGMPFPDGAGLVGGAQDNGTLLGGAGSRNGWLPLFGGDGGYVAINPRDRRVIYLESQNGNLQKSSDGGASFSEARSGLPPGDGRFLDPGGNFVFVTPFVMDPHDPDTLWIGGKRMYRTIDGAGSWQLASRALKGRATAISVSPVDRDQVLVGTESGFIHVQDRALSAGGSTRWRFRRPRAAWVTSVAHDPVTPERLYATYGGFGGAHVYRSDDDGRRWSSLDGEGAAGLPDIPVHDILIDPDDPLRLILGTDLGVFVSPDGGVTWAQENSGFGNIVTESLSLQQQGGKRFVYAFTHGRGAWRVVLRR